jgi:hypothetical protein
METKMKMTKIRKHSLMRNFSRLIMNLKHLRIQKMDHNLMRNKKGKWNYNVLNLIGYLEMKVRNLLDYSLILKMIDSLL